MAVKAMLRATAGKMPRTTAIWLVAASAADAAATPPAKKQSSDSQISSNPAASAFRAIAGIRAGGSCGERDNPIRDDRIRTIKP